MSAVTVPRPRDIVYAWFTQRRWTEAEYLLFANDQNALLELSDGKVVLHEMPTPHHQAIVLNLAAALRQSAHGKAYVAPMPVRLRAEKMREPDVAFYRLDHLDRIHEQFADPPDLVVEVLSPSTRAVDLGEKLTEYAQAGIPEYWAVDPETQSVMVYTLDDQRYALTGRPGVGAHLSSPMVPDLALAVDDVFAT